MAKVHLVLVVMSVIKGIRSTGEISVKCTTEFCEDYVQRFPCPPLDPACSNSTVSLVLPSATVCNCCEQCFLFQELDEDCVIGHPGQSPPKVMCGPGMVCSNGKCKKMTAPDVDFHPGYECQGEKCQCTVVENNAIKKIFGAFEKKDIKGEKQCECAISAYLSKKVINEFLPLPNAFAPSPRCLPNGQFDPLQCFDDICGCVNRTTGMWESTVRRVPISALGPKNPICFDQTKHKVGQYYTDCEKERNHLMFDKSWEDQGGINVLISHTVQCTPDGRYLEPQQSPFHSDN